MEARVANERVTDPDKLNLELGFATPASPNEKTVVDSANDSETAYTDTPDEEEPNEAEKKSLRRSKELISVALW